jgi:hypothetical protein
MFNLGAHVKWKPWLINMVVNIFSIYQFEYKILFISM